MTTGPISFAEMYPQLPYQYPLAEAQPIVRIPVAGPEPFNTLVVVRFQLGVGEFAWADGKFHAVTVGPIATGFTWAGDDDPRGDPPEFQHSSMAMLNHQQLESGGDWLAGDSPFVHAFDEVVDGSFQYVADKWRWCLTWKIDWLADQAWAAATAYMSSWVLCWEPPREPTRHRGPLASQVFQNFDPHVAAVEHGPRSGPGGRPRSTRVSARGRRLSDLAD